MPTSKVTSIMADLESVLGAITGVQKVWKVGMFHADLVSRADDTDFPVILFSARSRRSTGEHKGANRPRTSTLTVAILALDNGEDESDDTWGADRAEELERLIDAAVLADPKRGGHAYDTRHTETVYNPADFAQAGAVVGMEFEIRHVVKFGDLSAQS